MNDKMPSGRIKRTISSGKMVTKLGTNQLGCYLKKPFLSEDKKHSLKMKTDLENAGILFAGLSFLRGTALKAAHMVESFIEMGDWFCQLFLEEEFDFGAQP
ncbi:MAG: hypothetical protein L3J69_07450 [Desulfobacula sp.]|nr:hypothetical protein [Desulfobacula sp.]